MLTIRGVFDGKTVKVLPTESIPSVQRQVPVAIIFLEDVSDTDQICRNQIQVAQQMRAARAKMLPLGVSVKELVEQGRER
jgi:hypothetical protein